MALFGKKAPQPTPDASSTTPAPAAPLVDETAAAEVDPFAAQVPAKGKVKKVKAAAPTKSRGVKSGTVVGLNIGNTSIKAVEVTSRGGEMTITGAGVVATPPDSYVNGNVLSVSALAGAIRTLWKQAGFKSKSAVFSVAGTGSLVVRVIEVPRMTDGELADNMRVDADRYIPFPPSEVIMDFKALRELPSDPDAPNMEVLLAAAQREVIDLHVKVVQSAKLEPRAIDVEPIAAARSATQDKRGVGMFVDYDDVSALLNVGATGTEISVLRGDVLVFTRSVPNGGDNLTTAISDGLGLARHDAERLKIERGDALPPAGYDPNAQNDAGFGFDEFGTPGQAADADFDFGTPTAATTGGAAGAGDPFDLDFFNQNAQSEPGAGHAQKEGENPDPSPFSFSFDDDVNLGAPNPTTATPATTGGAANATPSLGFDFDVTGPAPTPAPDAGLTTLVGDDLIPATGAPATGAAPATATDPFSFDAALPPASAPAPTPSTSFAAAPAAMPSAFDFSDFDLPAVAEPSAPVSSATTPVDETPPASAPIGTDPFSFQDAAAPAVAATPSSSFSLEKTPAMPTPPSSFDFDQQTALGAAPNSASSTNDPAPAPAPAGEFDLDAIFGSSEPASAAAAPVAASAPVVLEKTASSTNAPVVDETAAFDLGAAGLGASAGTGFNVGGLGAADDVASFGAGLSAGNLADTDAVALYQAISPVLEELAGEVRRSLEFHLGRYPDTTFGRILLIGGGAKLRNLDVYLTQMIGVSTTVCDPFSFVALQESKLKTEATNGQGPVCAVALGLAMRDFIE